MITPPYSAESEMSVIGCVLLKPESFSKVEFLKPDDFYIHQNRELFSIIIRERSKGVNVDLTLMSDLTTQELGGVSYIADMVKKVTTEANIRAYADRVLEMSLRRKAISVYQDSIDEMADPNVDYMHSVNHTSAKVDEQVNRLSVGVTLSVDDLIGQSADEMERTLLEVRTGVSTGIPEIDKQLGYKNLATGEITFLGAPSKNGKTLMANTITARCDLADNEGAHIFSIEMPALGMFNGVVSAMSGVPANFYARQAYYSKSFPEQYSGWMGRWGEAAHQLNDSGKITIDDRKDVTMSYICSEIKKHYKLMESKGRRLRLVVIDHLHRITFDTKEKAMTYAMGDDVRALKNVASDLDIAVLLLGQLNEKSKDRNPTAFDILDTSRVRHEIQAFIGLRLFRQGQGTFFGIYSDAQRYADHETTFMPEYVKMSGGVVNSLAQGETFTPVEQD
jgi:replicative DNA helicase